MRSNGSKNKNNEQGDVGYIISGIKDAKEVKVGDTLTDYSKPCKKSEPLTLELLPLIYEDERPSIPPCDALFESDAIVFKQAGISSICILEDNIPLVKLSVETETPYWGVWKKPGAPFLCLEPWWGIA